MMKGLWPSIFVLSSTLAIASCTATPPVTVRSTLPEDSEIGVVMFRDCTIRGQEDCDGSGLTAGSIFARVFSEKPGLRAVPLPRPVGAKEPLDDAAAATYAKAKGFRYVLNGDVDEYYRVAPMTFRTERAGVSVRLLNTENGDVVAFFGHRTHSPSNFTTPDAIIQRLARHVRDAISPVASGRITSR